MGSFLVKNAPQKVEPKTAPVPVDLESAVFVLWHFRLWSFQGRDTKLERFLAKNQLYSNEITKF